ncbi:hypothetical protein ACVST0_21630, partial [Yersinia enterocolitica]
QKRQLISVGRCQQTSLAQAIICHHRQQINCPNTLGTAGGPPILMSSHSLSLCTKGSIASQLRNCI